MCVSMFRESLSREADALASGVFGIYTSIVFVNCFIVIDVSVDLTYFQVGCQSFFWPNLISKYVTVLGPFLFNNYICA